MAKVTLKGSGQLNGVVIINKTIEMDNVQASAYTGSKRYEVILSTLHIYYPGVKVEPKNIGVNVVY